MTITKLGHSCLLIKEGDLTIMTDPGSFSTLQETILGVDVILITHQHQDHYFPESLRKVLVKNPAAKIYTVPDVGALMDQESIEYKILIAGQRVMEKDVSIEGFGQEHALIYPGWPIVNNTGYLIANRLFHPGDSLTVPDKPVEILAAPVAAPWMRLIDGIDYAKAVKPKVAFPIHDAILRYPEMPHTIFGKFLPEVGIAWHVIADGASAEF